MPLLTPRQRSPDQSEGENWLIDQWEASVMRVSWLRGRVVTAAVRRRGELIKVFTLSTHLTLPPSHWSLSLSPGLWLVITCTSHPRAVGRAGTAWSQWSGVTVTITLIGKLVAAQTQSWLFCRWLWQCEKLRNIQHEAYFCTGIVFGKVSNRCHIVWNVIKTKVVKIVYHILLHFFTHLSNQSLKVFTYRLVTPGRFLFTPALRMIPPAGPGLKCV